MKKKAVFFLLCVVAPVYSVLANDLGGVQPIQAPSPHGVDGQCQVCHVEPESSLNSWFTFASTKKKLIHDFNAVCQQCHGLDFGHGVGKKPALNRDGLPLDQAGNIACAITCHNIHITSGDQRQNRYHLRLKGVELCLSCHKK